MLNLKFLEQLFDAIGDWLAPIRFAARKFAKDRIEYYEYLADLMADSAGRRNLLDMFVADAERYKGTARGTLAAHWARRYEECGGDLAETWKGTIPDADLMVIRVVQNSGGAGLESALRDIARVSGTIQQARNEFVTTVAVGLVGIALACGALGMLPLFMEDALVQAFSFIPVQKWGPRAQSWLGLSHAVADFWLPALVVLVGTIAWVGWSLPNLIGPARSWLDRNILIYKLYRDFRGALFMATVASLVRSRPGAGGLRLQEALQMLGRGAEPWLRWHCVRISNNIDQRGALSPDVFDTGVLDLPVLFYLMDMVETRGFEEGLQKAGIRTERRATLVVGRRAKVLRWALLGASLSVVGGVLGLTQASVFEMKDVANVVLQERG